MKKSVNMLTVFICTSKNLKNKRKEQSVKIFISLLVWVNAAYAYAVVWPYSAHFRELIKDIHSMRGTAREHVLFIKFMQIL